MRANRTEALPMPDKGGVMTGVTTHPLFLLTRLE